MPDAVVLVLFRILLLKMLLVDILRGAEQYSIRGVSCS